MHLYDVNGDNYLGTKIPRNFSSKIQLVDRDRGVDRRAEIKMNAPLRYGGETFYQSGFNDGEGGLVPTHIKRTTLQVVTNFGWMIPYVACMIVITGMLAQFLITLGRFLKRRAHVIKNGDLVPLQGAADRCNCPVQSIRHARTE